MYRLKINHAQEEPATCVEFFETRKENGAWHWEPGTIVTCRPGRDEFLPSLLSSGPSDLLPVPPADGVGWLRLVVTIFLKVARIVRYRGCGVWVLTAFWGTLFQLAASPFNWINGVMEDVTRQVGRMLDNEAAREPGGKEADEQNLEDLKRRYPWWLSGQEGKESAAPPEKATREIQ